MEQEQEQAVKKQSNPYRYVFQMIIIMAICAIPAVLIQFLSKNEDTIQLTWNVLSAVIFVLIVVTVIRIIIANYKKPPQTDETRREDEI